MNSKVEHELQAPLLNLKNVIKQVKTGTDNLTILQGLDLQIKHAESLAIVGASGSGKSTLLGIMAGLDEATSGEVWLNGQPLHLLDEDQRAAVRAKGVGFVFQNFQLLPALTALENVRLPLEMSNQYSLKQCQKLAEQWLDKVGLSQRVQHYPTQLSGGEQQRVGIARAVVNKPAILLADEPTGNLDPELSAEIMQLFQDFKSVGVSVLIATHDIALINSMSCPIMELSEGRLVRNEIVASRHNEAEFY